MFNKLEEYEDVYGELNFNVYIIIIFGMENNVKKYRFIDNKQNAFNYFNEIYDNKRYHFRGCDDRGYDIRDGGKSILNGFDNDYGLMTMVGFNDTNKVYYWFDEDHIFISKEKNEYDRLSKCLHL